MQQEIEKVDRNVKERKLDPIAIGIYAHCQIARDRYRSLGMEIQAGVFDAYLKRIEEKFGVNGNSGPALE